MAESNDTPLDLDAIDARCEAATPGPWTTSRPEPLRDGPAKGFSPGVLIAATSPSRENRVYATPPGGQYPSADQRFIAAARTDVPALAREVRRLRAEVARLRAFRHAWRVTLTDHGQHAANVLRDADVACEAKVDA